MSDDTRPFPLVAAQHTADLVQCMIKERLIRVDEVPLRFRDIYRAVFASLEVAATPAAQDQDDKLPTARPTLTMQPAVPIDSSYTNEKISCLDCGQAVSLLKTHLKTKHNLTPEAYRSRWALPDDYPMVAPNVSTSRASNARKMQLGSSVNRHKPRR